MGARWQKYNLVYEKKQIDTSRKRGSASIGKYFCIQNYHKNRKLLDLEDYFQTRDDRPIDAPFFHVRTHNITSLAKYGHTHPTIKEYDDTTEVTGIRRQNQSPVSIITKVVELEADSTSRRDRHTDYRRKTVVSSHLSQLLDGNMQIS